MWLCVLCMVLFVRFMIVNVGRFCCMLVFILICWVLMLLSVKVVIWVRFKMLFFCGLVGLGVCGC